MTKPNEPTLTCSEVVERLTQLGYKTAWLAYESPRDVKWFRKEAEAILHSWRERRVPESVLNLVRQHIQFLERAVANTRLHDAHRESFRPELEELKAWLERREQIRKGAKHDSKSVSD